LQIWKIFSIFAYIKYKEQISEFEENDIMIIKSYSKAELAHLYAPGLSANGARGRLNRWINGDRDLLKSLSEVGYFTHQQNHYFTKQEVAIILDYLGEP